MTVEGCVLGADQLAASNALSTIPGRALWAFHTIVHNTVESIPRGAVRARWGLTVDTNTILQGCSQWAANIFHHDTLTVDQLRPKGAGWRLPHGAERALKNKARRAANIFSGDTAVAVKLSAGGQLGSAMPDLLHRPFSRTVPSAV